ncbi:hypothetical protein DPX16_0318 [Anabarilius grahami]|uniref:Uncharacterized protein n=1 Tax=Anabarilius grahami TaxID=495550 RepID=A0A3N0YC60_ANAGA|nr:hypothetical protein DPX16_0318 [Anabarilius grahami]
MIRWPDGSTSSNADSTFRIGRKKAGEDQLQPTVQNTLRKLSRPTKKNCPTADRRLDHAKPQVFIFKLLTYTDRELILLAARLHAPVKTSDGATLSFFPDFSLVTTKRRSAFVPVRKEMREAGIQNFLLYPATLLVILNPDSNIM